MVEPKAFQDALLAYHARPADREAEAVRAAVLEQVAAMLDQKADDYASEYGHVDGETGALEFGRGWRGEVKEDHYNDLRELADEVRGMKLTRGVAPSDQPDKGKAWVEWRGHAQFANATAQTHFDAGWMRAKDALGVKASAAPLSEERLHELATAAGFGFFGQWQLYQGARAELVAFARAVEAAHGVEGRNP